VGRTQQHVDWAVDVDELQTRINWLAFQRHDGKDDLVHSAQGLASDEPTQRFVPEQEFTDCQ